MKKVFYSVRTLFSMGVATLAGWLGLSGCDRSITDGGGDFFAEYGTPMVTYHFKVKVVDQADEPVAGLQVGVKGDYADSKNLTGKDGTVELKGSFTGFYGEQSVVFSIKDVDGEANGVVSDADNTEVIKSSDFIDDGNDGWSQGIIRKEITLKVERK